MIHKIVNSLGYEIVSKKKTKTHPEYNIWHWLRSTQNIRTVIDIGAFNGAVALFLSRNFNLSSLYAFEPLTAYIPEIKKKLAHIPNLQIMNVALSDHTGTEILHQNTYAPASSLMHVSNISKEEFPKTSGETDVPVQVERLDDVIKHDKLEKEIFIKIDVQGVEDRVIRGGEKIFSVARCVLIEMSFVPMYDGQPLFEDVHTLLVEKGFRFHGMKNQIHSEKSGEPLFSHCLYIRS